MKILLVYAHPEPRSLNGALKDFTVQHLQNAGHDVQVSDLYAMRWKAGLMPMTAAPRRSVKAGGQRGIRSTPSLTARKARISRANRRSCCGPIR